MARKSAFFYATPMKPPFFWVRRTRLNGIISPPYLEVTLDTFGFPVGGHLTARRAVSWPRLPKVALSGPQNAVFWPKINFLRTSSKKIYHYNGTPKRQPFCLDRIAGWPPGGRQGPFLGQKWPQNRIFLHYTHITRLFLVSDGPDSTGS